MSTYKIWYKRKNASLSICLVGGCSTQCTYPWASAVKEDNIKKTLLDLYRANIQSQVSWQWNSSFHTFFLIQSSTAIQSSQYKSFAWFHQELKSYANLKYLLMFIVHFQWLASPLHQREVKSRRVKLTSHKLGYKHVTTCWLVNMNIISFIDPIRKSVSSLTSQFVMTFSKPYHNCLTICQIDQSEIMLDRW